MNKSKVNNINLLNLIEIFESMELKEYNFDADGNLELKGIVDTLLYDKLNNKMFAVCLMPFRSVSYDNAIKISDNIMMQNRKWHIPNVDEMKQFYEKIKDCEPLKKAFLVNKRFLSWTSAIYEENGTRCCSTIALGNGKISQMNCEGNGSLILISEAI